MDSKRIVADITSIKTDIKDLQSSLPKLWEKSFFEFRSKMFTKLDKDYLKPIKDLQQETLILNTRTKDLRRRVEKLELVKDTAALS